MGGNAAVINRANKPVAEKMVVHQTPVANRAVEYFNFWMRS